MTQFGFGSVVAILALLPLLASCQQTEQKAPEGESTSTPTSTESAVPRRGVEPVAESVRQRWLKDRSYYAFVEIVDSELDPDFLPGATKQDVERALGPASCAGRDCYPNFTERNWLYDTERKILAANHAIFTFDEKGVLKSIDWVSE
jgi:hypothetical protein